VLNVNRIRRALFACGLLLLSTRYSQAAEAPSWRVDRGDVQVVVPLRPGGAFTATTSSLSGTLTMAAEKPTQLNGDLSMNLATIETGISLRNQHLREKYLEIAKGRGYDRAVLSAIQLDDADGAAFAGRSRFSGMLLLHGVSQRVTGTADVRPEGAGRRVKAEFTLTLTDFGITPPEYLGVGVAGKLLIKVQLTAVPTRPAN
jgi:polyisoprenoid-binding protein YceI